MPSNKIQVYFRFLFKVRFILKSVAVTSRGTSDNHRVGDVTDNNMN